MMFNMQPGVEQEHEAHQGKYTFAAQSVDDLRTCNRAPAAYRSIPTPPSHPEVVAAS